MQRVVFTSSIFFVLGIILQTSGFLKEILCLNRKLLFQALNRYIHTYVHCFFNLPIEIASQKSFQFMGGKELR